MERDRRRVSPLYLALLLALLLLAGFLFRRLVVYLVLVAVTSVITYASYYARIPVDLTPIFFLSVVISFSYGLAYSVLFVILCSLPAKLASGSGFGLDSIFYVFMNILVNFVLLSISPANIVLYGFLGSVAYFTFSGLFSGMVNNEIEKEIFVAVINVGVSFFYFMNFAAPLLSILGTI
jgi:hypothetical protein